MKSHRYDGVSATSPSLVPVWGLRISSPAARTRTHAAPAFARPSPMQVAFFPLSVPSDSPSREPHGIPAVRRNAARIMSSAELLITADFHGRYVGTDATARRFPDTHCVNPVDHTCELGQDLGTLHLVGLGDGRLGDVLGLELGDVRGVRAATTGADGDRLVDAFGERFR